MSLQEKLAEYHRNFEAVEAALSGASLIDESITSERQIDLTRKALIGALPLAVSTLLELMQFGKNEGVRLRAAQYLLDNALYKNVSNEKDEIVKLLQRLKEE